MGCTHFFSSRQIPMDLDICGWMGARQWCDPPRGMRASTRNAREYPEQPCTRVARGESTPGSSPACETHRGRIRCPGSSPAPGVVGGEFATAAVSSVDRICYVLIESDLQVRGSCRRPDRLPNGSRSCARGMRRRSTDSCRLSTTNYGCSPASSFAPSGRGTPFRQPPSSTRRIFVFRISRS